MQYIWCSFLVACLAFFLGLGPTLLLCPSSLRRYCLVLSPIIGYCYVTLICWFCYNLDIGGTDVYARYVLVPPAVFLSIALAQPRDRRRFLASIAQFVTDRDQLLACTIAIAAFLTVSLPFLVTPHGLTTISSGNLDSPVYALASRVLKESSRSVEMGNMSSYYAIPFMIKDTTFGAFVFPALNASLLFLKVHQIQDLSYIIFFCFSLPIICVIARHHFEYTSLGALLIVVLYAFNPIVYYTIYASFQSQILAMTLFVAMMLVHLEAATSCQRLSDYLAYLPFAVLLNWAISLTYSQMLPLIYAVIFFYILSYGMYRRSGRFIFNHGIFLLAAFLIMCIGSLYRAGRLLWSVSRLGGAEAGWSVPFVSPAGIFLGFVPQFDTEIVFLLSASVATLVLTGFVKEYRRNRPLFIKAGAIALAIYTGYLTLYFTSLTTTGLFAGYKTYKLFSFFLPMILPSLMLYMRDIRADRSLLELAIAPTLVLIIGCELFSSSFEIQQRPLRVVSRDMAVALDAIDRDSSIQSINIAGSDRSDIAYYWPIMWSAYFLATKKLYFQRQSYFYASEPERLIGEKTLLPFIETLDGPPTLVATVPDIGISTTITHALPDSAFKAGIQSPGQLPSMAASTRRTLKFNVKNLGNNTWPADGEKDGKHLLRLGNHWSTEGGIEFIKDDGRTPLLYDLRPGKEMELLLTVTVPGTRGRYILDVDMVQEDVAWFANKGSMATKLTVNVE